MSAVVCDVELTSTTANGNQAGAGGFAYIGYSSSVVANQAIFSGQRACNGGVFFGQAALSITFSNGANATGNEAMQYGGVVYLEDTRFSAASSSFTNNQAASGGVYFLASGEDAMFASCTTNNNHASHGDFQASKPVSLVLTNAFAISTFVQSPGTQLRPSPELHLRDRYTSFFFVAVISA